MFVLKTLSNAPSIIQIINFQRSVFQTGATVEFMVGSKSLE